VGLDPVGQVRHFSIGWAGIIHRLFRDHVFLLASLRQSIAWSSRILQRRGKF